MDHVAAFLEGFRDAWPDDIEPIDEAHLNLPKKGYGDVFYRGNRLPAPFHRGLGIEPYYGSPDRRHGERAARSLSMLLRDHAGAVNRMSRTVARVDEETRAAGARLMRCIPFTFHGGHPVPSMQIACEVQMIDDALTRTILRFHVDDNIRSTGWRLLRHELRAQERRVRQSGRGFEVDPVLAWHLAELTETQLARLTDLLAVKPVPGAEARGDAFAPQWDRTRLDKHGITLPRAVAWIRVESGHLVGKVHLGPTLTWNRGKLTATDRIPETMTAALVGRPLSALAQHESLPELTITSANLQRNGLTTVRVDIRAAMLPFPTGLRNLR